MQIGVHPLKSNINWEDVLEVILEDSRIIVSHVALRTKTHVLDKDVMKPPAAANYIIARLFTILSQRSYLSLDSNFIGLQSTDLVDNPREVTAE